MNLFFLMLHDADGHDVAVNVDLITSLQPESDGTRINFDKLNSIVVQESAPSIIGTLPISRVPVS